MRGIVSLFIAIASSFASSAHAQQSAACEQCISEIGALQTIADNATAVQAWVASLQANCTSEYPTNATQRELCDAVASAEGEELPKLFQMLGTIAYDALGVCSVFVPVCTQPCCDSATTPEQVHLALTGNLSEMSVTWVTLNDTQTSTVQWGEGPCSDGSFSNSASGFTRTYTQGGWLGVVHVAIMAGLQPGTRYCYRVGDANSGSWSQGFVFTTMPADVGSADNPLVLLQTGDMGYGPTSDATVAALLNEVTSRPSGVHMWLHIGDTSYDDGYANHNDIFMRKIQPIASTIPLLTVRGNHEATWWNGTAYSTRFYMPNDASTHGFYYSLNVGPLHLLMTDTETAFDTADIDDGQRAWIKADLAAVDNGATPFIIAAGHRPLYCTDKAASIQCGGFAAWLRGKVEDVYISAGVDVVVGAHEHGYERTYRLAHGNVTSTSYAGPGAPAYVVNGAAGNREGNEKPQGNQPWSAVQSDAVGYSVITLSRAPTAGAAKSAIEGVKQQQNATLAWQHYASAGRALVDEWAISK